MYYDADEIMYLKSKAEKGTDEIKYLKKKVEKLEKILARTLELLGRYDEYTDYEGYTSCLLCADDFSNLCYELEENK